MPELPEETVARLTSTYGLDRRDVETLIGLDEYTGCGIAFFEDVVSSDTEMGKKVSNW